MDPIVTIFTIKFTILCAICGVLYAVVCVSLREKLFVGGYSEIPRAGVIFGFIGLGIGIITIKLLSGILG